MGSDGQKGELPRTRCIQDEMASQLRCAKEVTKHGFFVCFFVLFVSLHALGSSRRPGGPSQRMYEKHCTEVMK